MTLTCDFFRVVNAQVSFKFGINGSNPRPMDLSAIVTSLTIYSKFQTQNWSVFGHELFATILNYELTNIFPINKPAAHKSKPARFWPTTLVRAIPYAPLSKRRMVSNAKLEKVVRPPKNPITRAVFTAPGTKTVGWPRKYANNTPAKKHPKRFTTTVAQK